MKTIFDFNPTDLELKRFGSRDTFEKAKEYGVDLFANSDNNLWQIGLLFSMRGDNATANHYWNQMKDKRQLKILVQDF